MLRWLFLAFIIYLIVRFVVFKRVKNRNDNSPFSHLFGGSQSGRNGNLDHIEEAEFEDITEKENQKKKSNP